MNLLLTGELEFGIVNELLPSEKDKLTSIGCCCKEKTFLIQPNVYESSRL